MFFGAGTSPGLPLPVPMQKASSRLPKYTFPSATAGVLFTSTCPVPPGGALNWTTCDFSGSFFPLSGTMTNRAFTSLMYNLLSATTGAPRDVVP